MEADVQLFVTANDFSPKHFATNTFILMGKLWGRGVRIDAEYSSSPYKGIAIEAPSGDLMTINAGPGKNVSVTFLGALVSFSGSERVTNSGERREVIQAFYAPFWDSPVGHDTIAFLKSHEGATIRLL